MVRRPWRRQARSSPASQRAHSPQPRKTSSATRSPSATPHRAAASGPTASTTPTTSWPGTNAHPGFSPPVNCSWSVPHSPHASTRRTPLSARTSGSGTEVGTNRRGASRTRAVATSATLSAMADETREPLSDEEQDRRRQAIKGIFPSTPFMGLLGISFDRYEPDDVVVRLPFHEQLTNDGEVYHGGVIATMLDTAGAAAAWSNHDFDKGARASTVALSVQYVGAARRSDLVCHGRAI